MFWALLYFDVAMYVKDGAYIAFKIKCCWLKMMSD